MPGPSVPVQQTIRRRRLRRHAKCAGVCLGTCAVGGSAHAAVFLVALAVFTNDTPSSFAQFMTALLLGLLNGAACGVLSVVPFNMLAARRRLAASSMLLLLGMGVVSVVCALLAGLTVTFLEGSGVNNPYPWITFLLVLVFGSPLVGIALGLVAVKRRVPMSWTPFPEFCCQHCGYDLRGLAAHAACPECGLPTLASDTADADQVAPGDPVPTERDERAT